MEPGSRFHLLAKTSLSTAWLGALEIAKYAGTRNLNQDGHVATLQVRLGIGCRIPGFPGQRPSL